MTSHPDCVYPRCWCELGKCAARAEPTESLRLLMQPLAYTIPNRLHGAAINARGEAI